MGSEINGEHRGVQEANSACKCQEGMSSAASGQVKQALSELWIW